MSRVLTVLLWPGPDVYADEGLPAEIEQLNRALAAAHGGDLDERWPFWSLQDLSPGLWGGTKGPAAVFGGALKNLTVDVLARAVLTVDWPVHPYPGAVRVAGQPVDLHPHLQLMVMDDDHDHDFRVYRHRDLQHLADLR